MNAKHWKLFLGNDYSKEITDKGWTSATHNIFNILKNMEKENTFKKLDRVFKKAYSVVFLQIGINYE